jgi:hypothetical protein
LPRQCGLRLPVVVGTVPALRRRWLRRFGWYPGDWIWLTLPALASPWPVRRSRSPRRDAGGSRPSRRRSSER